MPLIRYRTGDLTALDRTECACGRTITLPRGVYGRVDNRIKVKSVKLYPDAIRPVLAEFPSLTGESQIELTTESGTDHFSLACEAADPTDVDTGVLSQAIEMDVLIRLGSVELVDSLDADVTVLDRRH